MHSYIAEMMECPACHGRLDWRIDEGRGDRIETADTKCSACGISYPIREGIGVFLLSDLARDDLWAEMEGWLPGHLREHPEVERLLMESPLEDLNPADQRFRANVLESRGQHDEAQSVREAAAPIYTTEQTAAAEAQTEYVLSHVASSQGPILDLASGGCALVEAMARRTDCPIIATDFSPTVLRRARVRLAHLGLDERVSFVSFDARQTPMKAGSVQSMTSNQGLPNIRDPGGLLTELRRIVAGEFIAISLLYDEADEDNAQAIRELGVEDLLHRSRAVASFQGAGWEIEVVNSQSAFARPTPRSELLGAGIDGLPVKETTIEYCVLLARPTAH